MKRNAYEISTATNNGTYTIVHFGDDGEGWDLNATGAPIESLIELGEFIAEIGDEFNSADDAAYAKLCEDFTALVDAEAAKQA